jgi:hypothetical protein
MGTFLSSSANLVVDVIVRPCCSTLTAGKSITLVHLVHQKQLDLFVRNGRGFAGVFRCLKPWTDRSVDASFDLIPGSIHSTSKSHETSQALQAAVSNLGKKHPGEISRHLNVRAELATVRRASSARSKFSPVVHAIAVGAYGREASSKIRLQ